MDLKQHVAMLPALPGVYLMKAKDDTIIYVGKAKNLKARVSQYFYNSRNHSPKTKRMVGNIHSFEYRITDTELDAFLTECKLIRQLQPAYNRQLKNPKKYVYIELASHELYPRLHITHEKKHMGSLYFGPFTSVRRVTCAVEFLETRFPVRKCGSYRQNASGSGCLYVHIGLCPGTCTGKISPEEYMQGLQPLVTLLEGKDTTAIQALEAEMYAAAEHLEFDKAAQCRDWLSGMEHLLRKQNLHQSCRQARNIVAVEFVDPEKIKVFLIHGNKLLSSQLISLLCKDIQALHQELKLFFIKHFNISTQQRKGLEPEDVDEAQILYSYLRKKKVLTMWVPSSWLKGNNPRLDTGIHRFISQLASFSESFYDAASYVAATRESSQ